MENNELVLRIPTKEEMAIRISEAVGDIEQKANAVQTITNEEEMAIATEIYVQDVKSASKLLESARKTFKAPFADKAKEIDEFFKPYLTGLEVIERRIGSAMSSYKQEQDRKAAELERKLREKAVADAKAQQEEENRKAAAEKREAAPVEVALPTVAKMENTTKTESGAKVTFVTRWNFEIVDPSKIPAEWLVPDEVKIGQAVRRSESPVREIPGVRIYSEQKPAGRNG